MMTILFDQLFQSLTGYRLLILCSLKTATLSWHIKRITFEKTQLVTQYIDAHSLFNACTRSYLLSLLNHS